MEELDIVIEQKKKQIADLDNLRIERDAIIEQIKINEEKLVQLKTDIQSEESSLELLIATRFVETKKKDDALIEKSKLLDIQQKKINTELKQIESKKLDLDERISAQVENEAAFKLQKDLLKGDRERLTQAQVLLKAGETSLKNKVEGCEKEMQILVEKNVAFYNREKKIIEQEIINKTKEEGVVSLEKNLLIKENNLKSELEKLSTDQQALMLQLTILKDKEDCLNLKDGELAQEREKIINEKIDLERENKNIVDRELKLNSKEIELTAMEKDIHRRERDVIYKEQLSKV